MAARNVVPVRFNRWVILAAYALLTACTQFLWLAYAPITAQTHRIMGVSEGAVGDLAGVFPLVYVILALPAGRWLDARFERALGLGAALTGAGGLVRLAGPSSYGWAIAGQFVIAVGQPFVLNSITKVAGRYFPSGERTAAVSIGSVALFAGILGAVLSGGPLLDAGGLTLLLRVQAAAAILAALWVLAVIRAPVAYPGDPSVASSLRWLRGDRFMWLLGGLLFVGMGVFNAVATWLDSILTHFGHGGASGALMQPWLQKAVYQAAFSALRASLVPASAATPRNADGDVVAVAVRAVLVVHVPGDDAPGGRRTARASAAAMPIGSRPRVRGRAGAVGCPGSRAVSCAPRPRSTGSAFRVRQREPRRRRRGRRRPDQRRSRPSCSRVEDPVQPTRRS